MHNQNEEQFGGDPDDDLFAVRLWWPFSGRVAEGRLIGANGKLVGYGGGLWRKQRLLEPEAYVTGGRT